LDKTAALPAPGQKPTRTMAKAALIALGLTLIAADAHAITRYYSTSMTCATIQATVQADGEAILRWIQPPDILRYDRYVANRSYCDFNERLDQTTVPAADTTACPVYRCKRFDPNDLFPFGPFFD
jgi:hypothetical protein